MIGTFREEILEILASVLEDLSSEGHHVAFVHRVEQFGA